jgi:hypothetical protein
MMRDTARIRIADFIYTLQATGIENLKAEYKRFSAG